MLEERRLERWIVTRNARGRGRLRCALRVVVVCQCCVAHARVSVLSAWAGRGCRRSSEPLTEPPAQNGHVHVHVQGVQGV